MLVSEGGILVVKESIGASWPLHTLGRGSLKSRDDKGDRSEMLLKGEVTPFAEEVDGYHYHRRKILQRDGHFIPSPYIDPNHHSKHSHSGVRGLTLLKYGGYVVLRRVVRYRSWERQSGRSGVYS